ncbi:MAG TPA: DUF4333 domain-containing protein [Solirubrobacteraceae bacterium]|jgi:hypothetical protein
MSRLRLLLPAVACALAFAACGEDVVEQSEVEDEAKRAITQEVGQAPKDIKCPGDLKAEKGEKMKCTLVAGDGSELDVTVTVTSAEGGEAKFDVQVGTEVRR